MECQLDDKTLGDFLEFDANILFNKVALDMNDRWYGLKLKRRQTSEEIYV